MLVIVKHASLLVRNEQLCEQESLILLDQETLPEGEGSVQLTSSY
jgi:hypothetical protein